MSTFFDRLSPWLTQIGWNSLMAIPLILIVAGLQHWARRWIAPQKMMALWLLALVRLLMPDDFLSPASVYNLPGLLPTKTVAWAQTASSNLIVPISLTTAVPSWPSLSEAVVTGWLAGVLIVMALLLAQTVRFHLRISRLRPCTDTALLDLLENVKEAAGVRTPISLVVSEAISAPVLYGFVRPRLLLPAILARTLSPAQLRCIFQHEIAHVRGWDIAVNWLVCGVVALHWFNPAVWWMARRMAQSREMACDQAVLAQKNEPRFYGEVMLRVAEMTNGVPLMAGAAGIVENKNAMKERIEMLNHTYGRTENRLAMGVLLLLSILFLSGPAQAEGPNDAAIEASVKAADAWLPIIDAGHYAESYDGFCVIAKTALTQDAWVKTNNQIRAQLGKLVSRTLKSKQFLSALPNGTPGQFVLLQYETEFEKLKATETVTTMLDKDGQWRIAGYYIRPRS